MAQKGRTPAPNLARVEADVEERRLLDERRGRALGRDHLLLRRERGGHEEHRGAHEVLFCRR